jgi:hypothetical protein
MEYPFSGHEGILLYVVWMVKCHPQESDLNLSSVMASLFRCCEMENCVGEEGNVHGLINVPKTLQSFIQHLIRLQS